MSILPRGGPVVRLEGRNGEVWRRWAIYGWTQEKIADEYGITQQTVSAIIQNAKAALPEIDRTEMRQQSLEFMREVQAKSWEIAEMAGAPVVVGKDGNILYEPALNPDGSPVIDDEGNVVTTNKIVRDYSGRLRALETAVKVDEQIAKRFGLSDPARSEVDMKGSVRYEIVDVPTEDLT